MNEFNIPTKSKFNNFAVEWIKKNLIPIKHSRNPRSSYFLKHQFENATGLYMTNGEFKYAMRDAGFKASNTRRINWTYAISEKSPGLFWIGDGWKRSNNYSRSNCNYKVDGWKPISEEKAIKLSKKLEET